MMVHQLKLFGVLGLLVALVSACTNSYVDPTFGKVGYDDLERRANPYEWQVDAQFQRNGEPLPQLDDFLKNQVEQIVRASGVALPVTAKGAPILSVTMNNVADLGKAAAKGVGTGLTFGLAGSLVTDFYEMTVVLKDGDKVIQKPVYKHAIHSTVGNADGPAGLKPVSPNEAFLTVVEELMLNALKDLETELKAPAQTMS